MNKNNKVKVLFILAIILLTTGVCLSDTQHISILEEIQNNFLIGKSVNNEQNTLDKDQQTWPVKAESTAKSSEESEEEVLYLSEINYIPSQSSVGWDRIRYNQIENNGKISLKIENSAFVFEKGIWAHATSQVTYDISEYNYKYFTAFVGINTSSNSGNGVIFSIYTSETGKDWVQQKPLFREVKLPGQNASKVKVSIEGAKYLRLIATDNGSNANDHSVYADAKLVNTLEEQYEFKSVEEYDKIIKEQYAGQEEITGDLEFNLLRREFVKRIGQFTLSSYKNASENNKETIDWLFNNKDVLRYFILGGTPERSYYNSLTELTRIYTTYKEDFYNNEVTKYGTKLSDLYTRMAIAMALTHDFKFGLWIDQSKENLSDAVNRYKIYKDMHKNGNFVVLKNADGTPKLNADGSPSLDVTKWFENYTVEEMRYIFNNQSDDEEVLWLNEYTQSFIDKYPNDYGRYLSPHPYMDYRTENLGQAAFYDPNKKDAWDKTFKGLFSKYNITYRSGLKKIWMFLRNDQGILTGAVCGGISKIGSSTRVVHGIPAVVIGQPGHAAILYYWQDNNGNGYWNIDNDVSGWAYSERGERLLLGWGNANTNYARGSHQVTYMALSQEALNDYDNLLKTEELIMLSDVYSSDKALQEEMYKNATNIQSINLDAWLNLINLYLKDSTKTEEDYYNLAEEISEALKYYPLPMYQLTNLIKPKLTSVEYSYKFTLLQTRTLKEASQTPNNSNQVRQPSLTRLMANFLLGQMDTSIANFSFDGEDAGKIVLSSRFDGTGVRWDYAINGKGENDAWDVSDFKEVSFSAEEEHKLQLTSEEIASITSENDIYIHIVGVSYAEENLYKIDILESNGLPSKLFASDLENKLLSAVNQIEWKYNDTDKWTKYGDKQPNLTGDKTIIVRMGATGTRLASKIPVTYTFTKDDTNNRRKYIPVEHISLHAVSSQATNNEGSATFALDANYNTRWHSAWDGSDSKRFITVKLDLPRNISAVEFVPAGGGNGKIYDGTIWGSMDGENWTKLSHVEELTYTNSAETNQQAIANIKSFNIDEPQKVQYIKIVADRTNGNWFTARAFNFYEDTTIKNVASFSFDGKNAGEIVLYDEFENTNWKYSIDNGNSWKKVTTKSHKLSDIELEQIDSKNKIKIMLDEDNNEYIINIKKGDTPEKGYLNDLENRPIGQPDKDKLEWKLSEDEKWTSYKDKEPNVTGNKTLLVRRKATGITSASDAIEYKFTEDKQSNKEKYVKISHLSIHGFSNTTNPSRHEEPEFAIDGLPTTMWHTNRTTTTMHDPRWIIIKLDEPKYISKIQYVRKNAYSYGILKDGIVSTSLDGENWETAATVEDLFDVSTLDELTNTEDSRYISIKNPTKTQYIKIELTKSYDYLHGDRDGQPMDYFFSAAMINLYEDITKKETPTAEIEYSTTENTNQNVTAKLVNPSTDITITNNGGKDTYTFTENGTFTFEFEDEDGVKGTAEAKVDWIIKTLPTATIEYSPNKSTNQNVTAEVSFDRAGTRIVDENGETIETLEEGEKYTVTFTENGTKEINFVGPYGNAGSKTLKVDWIDKEKPIGTIKYSTKNPTNQDVEATIEFNEENVTITNNGGKNKYTFTDNNEFTFEYKDAAGNTGSTTAKVDWIDRRLSTATITYSTTEPTNQDVVATVTFDKAGVIVEGGNTHTFTENGKYEFNFVGPAGNKGVAVAEVTWIDKKAPTAELSYSTTGITNQDVVVTVKFDEENVRITNNNGSEKHTFIENGEFTFEYEDRAGNKGTITAYVSVIDKVAPKAKVKLSTTDITNKDVIATLYDESEEITITSEGGNTHTFTENGTFTFEFVDRAGNKGSTKVVVNNINKDGPTGKVTYSETNPTNKNVTATLEVAEGITITSEGGNTHTFTENGEFRFTFRDAAGNEGSTVAKVDWIDKETPKAIIKYSTTDITNKNVIVTIEFNEENVIITSEGGNTHTFTKNGEFKFTFKDAVGNEGEEIVKVDWINKNAPIGTIKYSTEKPTNKDVVATLEVPEGVTITSEGGNTHTFTENGEFKFTFRDTAGNEGTATAKVTWISKKVPTGTVKYSTEKPTNKNVTATLEVPEGVTITSEGGNTHTFTENGEFRFTFRDAAGNEGSTVAKVDWIDKETPKAIIKYSATDITNKNVIVTIEFNEENVIITSEGGNTHIFTKNGEFKFTFKDAVGNEGEEIVKVDWINKNAPIGTIKYSTEKPTNKDVVATLEIKDGITITNNNGKNTYKFTENGEFTFKIKDTAGNEGEVTAKVTWINKKVPTGTVKYSTEKPTNKDVVATLEIKDGITITNNNGKNTYTFTENGEFTFEFVDSAGNKGYLVAKVDWINKNTENNNNNNMNNNIVNGNNTVTNALEDKLNGNKKENNLDKTTDEEMTSKEDNIDNEDNIENTTKEKKEERINTKSILEIIFTILIIVSLIGLAITTVIHKKYNKN